jgi:hypothetical protein
MAVESTLMPLSGGHSGRCAWKFCERCRAGATERDLPAGGRLADLRCPADKQHFSIATRAASYASVRVSAHGHKSAPATSWTIHERCLLARLARLMCRIDKQSPSRLVDARSPQPPASSSPQRDPGQSNPFLSHSRPAAPGPRRPNESHTANGGQPMRERRPGHPDRASSAPDRGVNETSSRSPSSVERDSAHV